MQGELCFSESKWQEAIDHYSRALFYDPQHHQALYKRLMSRLQIKDEKGLLINREAAQQDADKILLSEKPYFKLTSKEGKPLSIIAIEVSETGELNFGLLK